MSGSGVSSIIFLAFVLSERKVLGKNVIGLKNEKGKEKKRKEKEGNLQDLWHDSLLHFILDEIKVSGPCGTLSQLVGGKVFLVLGMDEGGVTKVVGNDDGGVQRGEIWGGERNEKGGVFERKKE